MQYGPPRILTLKAVCSVFTTDCRPCFITNTSFYFIYIRLNSPRHIKLFAFCYIRSQTRTRQSQGYSCREIIR